MSATMNGPLTLAGIEANNFEEPEETREFEKGKIELVTIGGSQVGRAVFEPGWRWSEHVKPLAGTDSCQAAHLGYMISGRMTVRSDDGDERTLVEGDVYSLGPGHDAWIEGSEPAVTIDFTGMANYAKA